MKMKFPSPASVATGEKEVHFGYEFVADENGELIAEIPDELAKIEEKYKRLIKVQTKKAE